MRKAWVFFKLRMKQMKYDKIGLFFSYVFPVILLLGIGYPVEMASTQRLKVTYIEGEVGAEGRRLLDGLSKQSLVHLAPYEGDRDRADKALFDNEIQHLLVDSSTAAGAALEIKSNSLQANKIAAIALADILHRARTADPKIPEVAQSMIEVSRRSSYLAVLLPGVIAMTMLVIGLSGFGSVLMSEETQGLYRNLKSIDVSPVPFFAGLFFSRMLVAYTVALAMFAVSVFVLDVPPDINYPLLFLVVTLGGSLFLGIGLLIYLYSPTPMAFGGIVSVAQLPLILLGGVFFSVSVFPSWIRPLAEYSPMAPFTSALRDLMFGGVGMHNVSELFPALGTLAAWLLVIGVLTKIKFRW
jgi:ABC-2 type transport system permease protein